MKNTHNCGKHKNPKKHYTDCLVIYNLANFVFTYQKLYNPPDHNLYLLELGICSTQWKKQFCVAPSFFLPHRSNAMQCVVLLSAVRILRPLKSATNSKMTSHVNLKIDTTKIIFSGTYTKQNLLYKWTKIIFTLKNYGKHQPKNCYFEVL